MQDVLTIYLLLVAITVAGALGARAKFHWTELSPQRDVWRAAPGRQRVTSLSNDVCSLHNNYGETPQHNC